MKVYIVMCDDGECPIFVVGVYRTLEKALSVCDENWNYFWGESELESE